MLLASSDGHTNHDNKGCCTTFHRYPVFSRRYSVLCKVYTGYCGTSEIEHGLCACTVDNPLAKLGDYLSVQAHKPCSISHIFCQCRPFLLSVHSAGQSRLTKFSSGKQPQSHIDRSSHRSPHSARLDLAKPG